MMARDLKIQITTPEDLGKLIRFKLVGGDPINSTKSLIPIQGLSINQILTVVGKTIMNTTWNW